MPHSMTAFARVEFDGDWGRGAWEIRSVNHRYAEVSVRAPEEFRSLETTIRQRVGNAVKRGKIDCNLRLESAAASGHEVAINEPAARAVLAALAKIKQLGGDDTPSDAIDVLRWPGVTESAEIDRDVVAAAIVDALGNALENFVDGRRREGEKMAAVIVARLQGVSEQLTMLRRRVPEIIESIRERHNAKALELAPGLDQARLEQECALLAQRLDVDEELDRLDAHVDEVHRVLQQKEPIGRRLDFLMQELNREANTLGSKSAHIDTAGAAIELKVLIEQMREQVQNIE